MKLIISNTGFAIIIITIIAIILLNLGTLKNSSEYLVLPEDCEMVTWNDSIVFPYNPFKQKKKAVIYMSDDALLALKGYIPYIEMYPETAVIVYFHASSNDKIVNWLKHIKFPYPVFIDPDNKFRNYGFIAYIVDENNKILYTTNPSLPDFKHHFK